ncbi:hypothetical protein U4E84_18335, partial [Halorubrum sp. AD140]|uniref:hypothetical protein n=1 Tax=Halorubrum sp. AD140 TaxID=3050073 RepID=UPI002ACC741D
ALAGRASTDPGDGSGSDGGDDGDKNGSDAGENGSDGDENGSDGGENGSDDGDENGSDDGDENGSDGDDEVDLQIRPAVEVVREAATPEHPPRLRATLTNAGDERVWVGAGCAVHFEYVADGCDALVLLPADGEYPAEPDCCRLTDDIAITEEYRTFALDPGESSERLLDLYATPGEDACLPVGEYRFETTMAVVSEDAEPESSAAWGFSVVLE